MNAELEQWLREVIRLYKLDRLTIVDINKLEKLLNGQA